MPGYHTQKMRVEMMENATLVLDLLQDVPFLDQKQGFL